MLCIWQVSWRWFRHLCRTDETTSCLGRGAWAAYVLTCFKVICSFSTLSNIRKSRKSQLLCFLSIFLQLNLLRSGFFVWYFCEICTSNYLLLAYVYLIVNILIGPFLFINPTKDARFYMFTQFSIPRVPITVYMRDRNSGGLKIIAEYGQEYGRENPICVLYHGYGHYDALRRKIAGSQSKQ